MRAVATTFRIDPRLRDQLNKLGQIRKMPMNRIVNQALERFVAEESALLEAELEASLADLRKLRQQDPDFEAAIGRFARAELSTPDDPVEGRAVLTGERRTTGGEQGATDLVRDLLGE